MIYSYRIVTKPLATKSLPNEVCPVCGKKGGVELTLYMKYLVALLPMYGLGRPTGVRCTLCTHEIKNPNAPLFAKKNYSPAIADAIQELRATHHRTTWQILYPWSFWWVMLVLIGCGLVYGQSVRHRESNLKEMLANPQPGDIYKAMWNKGTSGQYVGALVKVLRLDGDTLFVEVSKASIEMSYDKKEWSKLSGSDDAFDPQEHKLKLSTFKDKSDFFEYTPDGQTTDMGAPVSKGDINVDFDVIERSPR